MKFRLLISLVTLISAVFLCNCQESSADAPCFGATDVSTYISCDASDFEISSPDYTLQPPKPTNNSSFGQCRVPTRSNIKTVSSNRYHLFISGKLVNQSFIEVYQLIFNLLPTGVNNSHSHFISLGKLII